MTIDYASVSYIHLLMAIVCAKWARDLSFSQPRQLIWGIAGFIIPPLVMLMLYVRLIRTKSA